MYRDSAEKLLTDYPRPSLAVDTAVLTVTGGALCVALVQNRDGWRLPGTFVHERETLADAVLRSLRDKAHIEGLRPRQLHVFDAPGRDTRGWVISVAHLVVVPAASVAHVQMRPVTEAHGLVFDHDKIVELAARTLRAQYRVAPDPESLLGPQFTLLDLLRLHSAIAGEPLGKDTFRRHMRSHLLETDAYQQGLVGKPAKLFRHA
ncbi:NUDIX domain-containing protein [Cryobacterium melibiosiphilum]|uniref:NUDIX domain-containing protein n=1 Tax=Cryobacterium melibiosiphilum TaxID=995039 RepID=A0A3A5MJ88_9MICO|nr:NUDIX domain-containing protein [Cryobacterium melibiosiphilum]RJT88971.1 NUDIX domain-containing protein [Cryobacterium melibiosiphilum]